jgi:hypothetical protein
MHRVGGAVGLQPEGGLSLLPAIDPLGFTQIPAGSGLGAYRPAPGVLNEAVAESSPEAPAKLAGSSNICW